MADNKQTSSDLKDVVSYYASSTSERKSPDSSGLPLAMRRLHRVLSFKILDLLDLEDLGEVCVVSQQQRAMLIEYLQQLRLLRIGDQFDQRSLSLLASRALKLAVQHCKSVQSVEFYTNQWDTELLLALIRANQASLRRFERTNWMVGEKGYDKVQQALLECPNLEALTIENSVVNRAQARHAVLHCKNMKKICIQQAYDHSDDVDKILLGASQWKLTHFEAPNLSSLQLLHATSLQTLETLDLDLASDAPLPPRFGQQITEGLAKLTCLTELKLKLCMSKKELGDLGATKILLPNLTTLHYCNMYSSHGVGVLPIVAPALRSFEPGKINLPHLSLIAETKQLRSLWLDSHSSREDCMTLKGDARLATLLAKGAWPELRVLNTTATQRVLESASLSCSQMKMLDLHVPFALPGRVVRACLQRMPLIEDLRLLIYASLTKILTERKTTTAKEQDPGVQKSLETKSEEPSSATKAITPFTMPNLAYVLLWFIDSDMFAGVSAPQVRTLHVCRVENSFDVSDLLLSVQRPFLVWVNRGSNPDFLINAGKQVSILQKQLRMRALVIGENTQVTNKDILTIMASNTQLGKVALLNCPNLTLDLVVSKQLRSLSGLWRFQLAHKRNLTAKKESAKPAGETKQCELTVEGVLETLRCLKNLDSMELSISNFGTPLLEKIQEEAARTGEFADRTIELSGVQQSSVFIGKKPAKPIRPREVFSVEP